MSLKKTSQTERSDTVTMQISLVLNMG